MSEKTKINVNCAVIAVLDRLALALVEAGHHWSDDERRAYELAIELLGDGGVPETVH